MLRIRRWPRLLFTLLLPLQLLAVAGSAAPPGAVPLRVATSGDYPPFSRHNGSGQLAGFDISVAERFAADTQRPIGWVTLRWPDLVAQANDNAFDVAMSGVTIRGDRAADLLFSRPYAITGAVAVIPVAAQARMRTLTDLDRADIRIAVNRGGHLERVARQQFPHATIIPVDDNTTLPALLQNGTADAAISEAFEARSWSSPQLATLGPFTRDQKAYAVPRAAAALIPVLDAWLAARESDGWLNEQRQRWLGVAAATTPDQASLEGLVAAVARRVRVMPLIAAVKQRDHLPIVDAAQETRVLEQARAAAISRRLDPESVAAVFQVLIDAAKAVQTETASASVSTALTLTDLRTVIASVNEQIVAELARSQAALRTAEGRAQFTTLMSSALQEQAVPEDLTRRLVESIIAVYAAA